MKDAFDRIQIAFAEALVEASENFLEAKENATADSGVKFSERDRKPEYQKESNQEVIGNEGRRETRKAFDRRTSEEVLTKGQTGGLAYAYRPYLGTAVSEKAKTAEAELKKIGIPVFIYEKLETNSQGITMNHENAGAGAIPGVGIFIPFNATADSMEIVGHEGFHFLATTKERANYISALVDNIDFASAEFVAFQTKYLQEKYFEEEVGTESDDFNLLTEEIFAYITGAVHNGDPKGEVHKFIRDYDAVKVAWDNLISAKESAPNGPVLYSERDKNYDKAAKQLEAQNEKLREDVTYLKKMLKLQKSLTHGKEITKSSVEAARVLKKYADASGNTKELAGHLDMEFITVCTFYRGAIAAE